MGSNLNIKPSKRSVELNMNYQYQNPYNFLSNKRMMFTISQYFQYAIKFGYPYYYRNENNQITEESRPERYQLNSNTLIGWQFLTRENELSGLGVFFRAYWGRNYHGQFRNIPYYPYVGISIIFDGSLRK